MTVTKGSNTGETRSLTERRTGRALSYLLAAAEGGDHCKPKVLSTFVSRKQR